LFTFDRKEKWMHGFWAHSLTLCKPPTGSDPHGFLEVDPEVSVRRATEDR